MQFKTWGFTRYGRFKKDAEVKEPVTKSQEISTTVALILTLFVKTCLLWEVDSLWKSTNKLISKWVSVETLHLTHSSFFPSKVHEGSQLLLSACLSCDGCVSEEESLKISQQSLEEVDRVLALNKVQRATKLPLKAEKVREMSCVTLLSRTLHCPHCFSVPVRGATCRNTGCW